MTSKNSIKELTRLYSSLNEISRCSGNAPFFKPTSRIILAISEIEFPEDRDGFEKLVKNLFILFYEGSLGSKSLIQDLDNQKVIQKLKELRNHFEHDREHGDDSEVRRKYQKIGEIFDWLIGKKYPIESRDWALAGSSLIQKFIDFLNYLTIELPNIQIIASRSELEEFFDHKFTLFPSGVEKFHSSKIRESDFIRGHSLIFLPTFKFSCLPEFGDTRQAIYLTSEAHKADFDDFKNFVIDIEDKWTNAGSNDFGPDSKLTPWSITLDNRLVYGSGAENLIEATKGIYRNKRASFSMVLQGIYGEDNTCTFFIVIGSDIKGGSFRYNFMDFYLSSVPIDWEWIKLFNNSMDELSKYNVKATNYALKSYRYYEWHSEQSIKLKKGIIGGFGRNGFENRNWDSFEGLVINSDDLPSDFKLDPEESWKSKYGLPLTCPNEWLEEFVASPTNDPPSFDELKGGNLTEILNPKIYALGFPAKGWGIFALNIWGVSQLKEDI